MKLKIWQLYLYVIAFSVIIYMLINGLLFTRYEYFKTYGEQLEDNVIDKFFNVQSKSQWMVFILLPFFIFVKSLVILLCIQTGLLIHQLRLSLEKTLKIVLLCEMIFFVPQVIKLFWFLFIDRNFTITDVQLFSPLSALNIFDLKNIPSYLIYPFQTLNLFEIAYCLILAYEIKSVLKLKFDDGLKVVFSGYVPALVIWVLCTIFLTAAISPSLAS